MHWYNRNIAGTHFGGSLYAMVDPQLMVMFQLILGSRYIVWDKAAEIDYIKPGKGKVSTDIITSPEEVELIKQHTKQGDKYFHHHNINIQNEQQETVCKVKKTVYIRQKSTAA